MSGPSPPTITISRPVHTAPGSSRNDSGPRSKSRQRPSPGRHANATGIESGWWYTYPQKRISSPVQTLTSGRPAADTSTSRQVSDGGEYTNIVSTREPSVKFAGDPTTTSSDPVQVTESMKSSRVGHGVSRRQVSDTGSYAAGSSKRASPIGIGRGPSEYVKPTIGWSASASTMFIPPSTIISRPVQTAVTPHPLAGIGLGAIACHTPAPTGAAVDVAGTLEFGAATARSFGSSASTTTQRAATVTMSTAVSSEVRCTTRDGTPFLPGSRTTHLFANAVTNTSTLRTENRLPEQSRARGNRSLWTATADHDGSCEPT